MSVPVVRHFLVCLGMEYDWGEALAPYCLRNLLFRYRPPAGAGYPYVMPDLWVFTLLVGEDRQELWLEVWFRGPPDLDPDEELESEFVAAYGPFVALFGPDPTNLQRGWHLGAVPFDQPGVYEVRLLHEGVTIAEELVELEN